MSAAGTQTGPEGVITKSVLRAPATAQEGEALTLISYTMAAGWLKNKVVWLIPDSLSSTEVLRAYHQTPKTHGMMSQIISQALLGCPLLLEACVQVLATPSHRWTIINKAADWACLLQPQLRGDRMFRHFSHFAPREVVDQVYQLGRPGHSSLTGTPPPWKGCTRPSFLTSAPTLGTQF